MSIISQNRLDKNKCEGNSAREHVFGYSFRLRIISFLRQCQSKTRPRTVQALACLVLILSLQVEFTYSAFAQTKPVPTPSSYAVSAGDSQVPSGAGQEQTQNTVPNPYQDADATIAAVQSAAGVNQQNINNGVQQIITGYSAPLVFQAAEQNQGTEIQTAAANVLNGNMGSVNDTYRGLHQWFKDDLVGNLFSNIGQLAGKWMTEFINGWLADAVQFLAKYLRIFVLNPNIAVNGLNGGANDGISSAIRAVADTMYGIAVDLLLLLFILCIWKFWADASWNGAGNLMAPVGRLIFTAGLLLAWPTIYAFVIQISNEMITAIYFDKADEVLQLHYALAQAVKGGVIAAGQGATNVFSPVLSNLSAPQSDLMGQVFYFASTMIYTILGGILVAELVYILVLKAIQTALLTAQYMFAPIFLVFFATPDTESYATGYVLGFVETSLWTFVWVGLLRLLVVIVFSDFNPWGKILISLGVLQMMIQVPTFIRYAQISPSSDFVSASLVYGKAGEVISGLKGLGTGIAGAATNGLSWIQNGGTSSSTGMGMPKSGLPGQGTGNGAQLEHSLSKASALTPDPHGRPRPENLAALSAGPKLKTGAALTNAMANNEAHKGKALNTAINHGAVAAGMTHAMNQSHALQPSLATLPPIRSGEVSNALPQGGKMGGLLSGDHPLHARTNVLHASNANAAHSLKDNVPRGERAHVPGALRAEHGAVGNISRSALANVSRSALANVSRSALANVSRSALANVSRTAPADVSDPAIADAARAALANTAAFAKHPGTNAIASTPSRFASQDKLGADRSDFSPISSSDKTQDSSPDISAVELKDMNERSDFSQRTHVPSNTMSLVQNCAGRLLTKLSSPTRPGLHVAGNRNSVQGSPSHGVKQINIASGANQFEVASAIYSAAFADNIASDPAARSAAEAAAFRMRGHNLQEAQLKHLQTGHGQIGRGHGLIAQHPGSDRQVDLQPSNNHSQNEQQIEIVIPDEHRHSEQQVRDFLPLDSMTHALPAMAANWRGQMGNSWRRQEQGTPEMQRAVFAQAVHGSQDYVAGLQGNEYSDYLRTTYGPWSNERQAEAVQFITHMQTKGVSMGSTVDASSAHLVSGGVPLATASKLAMENVALQGMHPSRRKQAVHATLAYTYARASAIHPHASIVHSYVDSGADSSDDSREFAVTHGALARELPANDLHDVLSIYQIAGHADLASPAAPQYIEICRNVSAKTDMDLGSVYSHLAKLAPKMAQRLNCIEVGRDLSNVRTFSDLSGHLKHAGLNQQTAAPLMKRILEAASAEVIAQHQQAKIAPPHSSPVYLQNGQIIRSV